jgi:hypothetical protein
MRGHLAESSRAVFVLQHGFAAGLGLMHSVVAQAPDLVNAPAGLVARDSCAYRDPQRLPPAVSGSARIVSLMRSAKRIAFGIVAKIKGYTSRELRNGFPWLKKRLPTLCKRSKFISTIGATIVASLPYGRGCSAGRLKSARPFGRTD